MYHTTGFTEDEIVNLCALIYANEEDCDIDPWPPSLGLYKPIPLRYVLSRCVTGGGRGCAHAGTGGIQGFPVRASRMAVMTSAWCLRAVSM